MKTMKFFVYAVFVLSLGISFNSCKGEDGAPGPAGQDGVDGNANVKTFIFTNPTWDSFSRIELSVPDITSDVVDNDVILGYWYDDFDWTSTNAQYWGGILRDWASVGTFTIEALEIDGTVDSTPPQVYKAKVVIIESTSTTTTSGNGKNASPKQAIYDELKSAGVNVNDYYQVCDYYGINP